MAVVTAVVTAQLDSDVGYRPVGFAACTGKRAAPRRSKAAMSWFGNGRGSLGWEGSCASIGASIRRDENT